MMIYLSLFLSFFQWLKPNKKTSENKIIIKKNPENKNLQKQKQKINSELALYPLPHVLIWEKERFLVLHFPSC